MDGPFRRITRVAENAKEQLTEATDRVNNSIRDTGVIIAGVAVAVATIAVIALVLAIVALDRR